MERGLLVARIFDAVRGPRSGASSGRCPLRRDAFVAGLLVASALLAGAAVPALADSGVTVSGGATASSEGTVELPRILRLIAECESGGNPRAISPGGLYRGKYQFSRETWRALGGTGDPADAPEWRQDRLALKLYRQSGTAPWPNCP